MSLPDALTCPLAELARPPEIPRRPLGAPQTAPEPLRLEVTAAERARVRSRFPDPRYVEWADRALERFRERMEAGERSAFVNLAQRLQPARLVELWRSVDPIEAFYMLDLDEVLYLRMLLGDELLVSLQRFQDADHLAREVGLRLGLPKSAVHVSVSSNPGERDAGVDWVERHVAACTPFLLPAVTRESWIFDLLVRHAEEAMPVVVELAMDAVARPGGLQARQLLPAFALGEAQTALFEAARAAGFEGEIAALAHPDRLLSWPTTDTDERIPPGWHDLPRPTIDGRPLDDDAMARLQVLLRVRTCSTHPWVVPVLDALDPDSVQTLADAILATFEASGKAMYRWLLRSYLTLTGPDGARVLSAKARSWARMKKKPWPNHALGVVDALLVERIPEAFTQLGILAGVLQGKAGGATRRKLTRAAVERGLTVAEAQLALAPSHAVDRDGVLTLDFGPRQLTVALDADFKPVIRDAKGKVRKTLPKPGKSDDRELAEAAHQAFKAFKSDVRDVLRVQKAGFEAAMTKGTEWRWDVWRAQVLAPGLLRVLAQRILWKVDGVPCRLVPGGDLVGLDDVASVRPGPVGVLHPLELGAEACAVWSDRFLDEGLAQPFPQLDRRVYVEQDPTGWVLGGGPIVGLLKSGWRANRRDHDDFGRLAFEEQRFDRLRKSSGAFWLEIVLNREIVTMDAGSEQVTIARWDASTGESMAERIFRSEALRDLERSRVTPTP